MLKTSSRKSFLTIFTGYRIPNERHFSVSRETDQDLQTDVFTLLLTKNNFAKKLFLYLLQFVPILANMLTIVESSLFYTKVHLYATPS